MPKTAIGLLKVLKVAKDSEVSNEAITNMKLSAKDLVKSLDIMIEEAQKRQSLFDQASKLAEAISKGECSEASEELLKSHDIGSEQNTVWFSSVSDFVEAAKGYMAKKEKLDKIALEIDARETGFFVVGVLAGIVSGYWATSLCKEKTALLLSKKLSKLSRIRKIHLRI